MDIFVKRIWKELRWIYYGLNVLRLEFCIYSMAVNTKFIVMVFFFIYCHQVNSKYTIWQMVRLEIITQKRIVWSILIYNIQFIKGIYIADDAEACFFDNGHLIPLRIRVSEITKIGARQFKQKCLFFLNKCDSELFAMS